MAHLAKRMFATFDLGRRNVKAKRDPFCKPRRRLGMETLERRRLLAAELLTAELLAADLSGPTDNRYSTEVVFWHDRDVEIAAGQWIVQFDRESDSAAPNDAVAAAQAWLRRRTPVEVIPTEGSTERRVYEFEDVLIRSAMLNAFSNHPGVIAVEPNYALSVDVVPDDPSFDQLWGLDNADDADIDAPEAWDLTTGAGNIVVGVIDTGVDYTHEDLAQNMWVNPVECPAGMGACVENGIDEDGNGYVDDFYGWDFINNDNDPFDDNSHGTHVAGTIAAVGNNGTGVVGVNWNAKIMALKFLGSSGSGFTSDAVEAIEYATMMKRDHGIDIRLTNNSWGGGGYSQTMFDAIADSRNADMLFVAAAGNDSRNTDSSPAYPASYQLNNILSVASTTSSDGLSSFSNYGSTSVDLGAPGSSIYSTIPGNQYGTKSGTSMASPHVAGVAALAWGIDPAANHLRVRNAIVGGVDPLSSLAGKTVTGGRLNANATLQRMGLFATVVSPEPNVIVDTAPTTFTLDFSEPINVGSVQASDLAVNSIAADGFTLIDSDTVEFSYSSSPVTVEGVQAIELAANSVTQASNGDGVSALSVQFFFDPTPLQVDAVTPLDGGILALPDPSVRLDFTEPLHPGSIGIDDLVLSDGRVQRFTIVDEDTVVYHLTGITNESVLSVNLPGGAVADSDGFPNQPFSASFLLDVGTLDYPGVWQTPAPLGSRVRQTVIAGLWHDATDEDRYVVHLQQGQSISLALQPSAFPAGADPTPRLRVLDAGGTPIANVTAAAGQSVVINSLIVPDLGDYTIVVETVDGTGGVYDLSLALSAVLEGETFSATDNDSLAAAQNIDSVVATLSQDVWQAGVVGRFDASVDQDWFAITMPAGVASTFAVAAPGLTQAGNGPLTLSIHDTAGTELAGGVTASDHARIDHWSAPIGGVYFINVGGGDNDYVLSATIGGRLDLDQIDLDRNGSIADAQALDFPPRVVGHLGGEFLSGPGVGANAIVSNVISLDSIPEGDMVRDLVYTPDGQRYLIAHRDSESVLVYEAATGNLLAAIPVQGKPVDLEVTPNGAYALSANTDGDTVTVIDLATLTKVTDIATSSAWPYRVHVTADSSQAVVATAADDYLVLSLSSFAEVSRIEASGLGAISSSTDFGYGNRTLFRYTDFALTPDGTKLVGPGVGVAGSTVEIYDLVLGTQLASIPVPDDSPTIVMTPDGSTVYAISRYRVFDSTISTISLTTNALVSEIEGPGLTTDQVLLSPDQQELIAGRYSSLQFISVVDGSVTSVSAGDTDGFAISHDGNYVLARDLIDLTTKSRVKSLPWFSTMDFVVASPTELRAFQVSRLTSDRYKLLDINGSAAAVLETRTGGSAIEGDLPVALEISADGLTAVTANYGSQNLSVIDLQTQAVTDWIDVGFNVDSLAITPDGSYAIAASGSASNSVVLVDLVAGNVDATLTGIDFFPRDVAISADGTTAYAVTTGLTETPDSLYFIDVAGAASVVTGSIPIGNATGGPYDYTRLQLSPDGSLLAIPVTGSGELVLIDTASGGEIARISTGQTSPTEVVFSPDGSHLFVRHLSGGGITAIRVDGANSNLQKIITGIPSPAAMAIGAAGDYLYVATSRYLQNNEVHVVDARSFDVIHTVSLKSEARPTRMHLDGDVLYLVATEEFTPQVFAAEPKDSLMRIFAAGVDSKLVDSTALKGRTRLVGYSSALQAVVTASEDQDLVEVIDFSQTTFGDEDYYSFLPQVGDALNIQTIIPGHEQGLIDNDLELAIEVFDPQGRSVATSDDGNLQFTADAIGVYSVHVFAQNFTRGEYLMSIDGATVTAGPSLIGLAPVDGQRDVAPDASLTLTFDQPVLAGVGSVMIKRVADDSTLTSIAATSGQVVIDGPSVTITPSVAWELGTDYYVLIDAGAFTGSGGAAFNGIADPTLWDFSVGFGFDFGDAPAPYPVFQSASGARHSLFGPQLGARRDSEPDGVPTADASGDDVAGDDDEDGVVFGTLRVGGIDASFDVQVHNVQDTAFVDAWIDFDGDGHFGGVAEQVAVSVAVVEGTNTIEFVVPAWVASGETFARVRLSSAGDLGVIGNAPDGEVEDYRITIQPPQTATENFYPRVSLTPNGSGGDSVIPADLDGDGDLDLIFPDGSSNNPAWLQNDGDGGFVERQLYSQWFFKYVEVVDFDKDGDMDVVYLASVTDEFGWLQNQGDETFVKHLVDNQLSTPQDFSVVDYDQDGDKDLILVDNFDDVLLYYENDGEQTFAKQTLASDVDASLLEVADLDHDGDVDFVVNDDGLSWYEQTATGLTQHSIATAVHYVVELFDVDSDGSLDIVAGEVFKVSWYENDGAGAFSSHLLLNNVTGVSAVEFSDFDGDGDMDGIAKGENTNGNLSWLENDGAQNFQVRLLSNEAGSISELTTADLDGDGDLDVVSSGFHGVAWFENVNGVLLTIEALSPPAGGAMVSPTQNLSIRFDQAIQTQAGAVTIHLASDDSVVETIDITSANVTVDIDTLIIDPVNDLALDTTYYVRLDSAAVKNLPGDPFAGFGKHEWEFQTVAPGIDWGDAPDPVGGVSAGNYNTTAADNGPSHVITAGIYLGRIADADDGTLQNGWAVADDGLGVADDEDGLIAPHQDLALTVGAMPTVAVIVSNLTVEPATLTGWIDYDADGVFAASESAQAIIDSGSERGIVTLTFPAVPAGSAGATFARFRIGVDAAATLPVGASGAGEVEDHAVMIRNAGLGTAAAATKLSSGIAGAPILDGQDRFGASFAALGDLDGDGVEDLAIAAPGDDEFQTDAGAVYIAMMNADGSIKSHQKILPNSPGLPFDTGDLFGTAIAAAGDLDHDGVADLYVMSKTTGNLGLVSSVSRVMLNADGTLKDHSYTLVEFEESTRQLNTFAPIGDLDGDGNPDFAFGEYFAQVNGLFSGALHIMLTGNDGTQRTMKLIASEVGGGPAMSNFEYFGNSVTSLGDLNGDGVVDLAVGAYGDASVTTNSGAVYILFMKRDGTVKSTYAINGTHPGEPTLAGLSEFGFSVANVGDLDGDGITELLVGSHRHSVGSVNNSGQAFVLYLASDGSVRTYTELGSDVGGAIPLSESGSFGEVVAPAGDLNGDGHVDLVVSSLPTSDSGRGTFHTVLLAAPAVPAIQSVLINDGSVARSQVTSLTVVFDDLVEHQELGQAFVLTNTDTNTVVGQLNVTADDSTGKTIVQIGFGGDSTTPRAGTGAMGNSLADGNYRLVIDASKIRNAEGTTMSSDHVFGQQKVDAFFRLFGDVDGDRDVDTQDYGQFGQSFLRLIGDPEFDASLDADGDGDVDGQDLGRFRSNLASNLPASG